VKEEDGSDEGGQEISAGEDLGTAGSPEAERGAIGGGGDCGAPGLAAAVGFSAGEDVMRGGGVEGRVSVGGPVQAIKRAGLSLEQRFRPFQNALSV